MLNSNKIETIRKSLKLTQSELAEQIGMTTKGYQNCIYKNEFKASVLYKISETLDVPITTFFEGEHSDPLIKFNEKVEDANIFQHNSEKINFTNRKTDKSSKEFIEHLKFELAQTKEKYEEALSKINDSEKNNKFYWNICTYMVDFTTSLFIKVAEWDEDVRTKLKAEDEMRRFIGQIKTLTGMSEDSNFFNNKFIELYENRF